MYYTHMILCISYYAYLQYTINVSNLNFNNKLLFRNLCAKYIFIIIFKFFFGAFNKNLKQSRYFSYN